MKKTTIWLTAALLFFCVNVVVAQADFNNDLTKALADTNGISPVESSANKAVEGWASIFEREKKQRATPLLVKVSVVNSDFKKGTIRATNRALQDTFTCGYQPFTTAKGVKTVTVTPDSFDFSKAEMTIKYDSVTKQFVAIREKSVGESLLSVVGIEVSDEPDTVFFRSTTFNYEGQTWTKPEKKQPNHIPRRKGERRYTGDSAEDYIDFFEADAKEAERHGIPAAITLAQGLLESAAGRSYLARNVNNHFGIKCHGQWRDCVTRSDDTPHDQFRVYNSAKESFDDHTAFLKRNNNYDRCFQCGSDVRCWLYQLRRSGYASDKMYDYKLAALIEKYDLVPYELNYDRKAFKR